VEVNYLFPDGKYRPHPVLVISTNDLFEDEEMFYGLLMSTKNIFPKYTVEIKPEWITKPLRNGYFVTHMLNMFTMKDVMRQSNTFLKVEYYEPIRIKIINSIFHHG
jgi:hypothetical protein